MSRFELDVAWRQKYGRYKSLFPFSHGDSPICGRELGPIRTGLVKYHWESVACICLYKAGLSEWRLSMLDMASKQTSSQEYLKAAVTESVPRHIVYRQPDHSPHHTAMALDYIMQEKPKLGPRCWQVPQKRGIDRYLWWGSVPLLITPHTVQPTGSDSLKWIWRTLEETTDCSLSLDVETGYVHVRDCVLNLPSSCSLWKVR